MSLFPLILAYGDANVMAVAGKGVILMTEAIYAESGRAEKMSLGHYDTVKLPGQPSQSPLHPSCREKNKCLTHSCRC